MSRPLLLRPKLKAVKLHFQTQLARVQKEGDPNALKQAVMVKKLMLDSYLGLINLSEDIRYHDWAAFMMIAVSKFAGIIMKMNLMKHAFGIIFSCYSYLSPVVVENKLQKYHNKYIDGNISYKDLFDISVDFSSSWGALNEAYQHTKEAPMEFLISFLQSKPQRDLARCGPAGSTELSHVFPLLYETQVYLASYLWDGARRAYYRLKNAGYETCDFDVLFQNETSPFPHFVFNHLALKFEIVCGWLPVGDCGLFSKEYLGDSEEQLKQSLYSLYGLIARTATFPGRWSMRKTESDELEVISSPQNKSSEVVTPKMINDGLLLIDGSVYTKKSPIPSSDEHIFPTIAMDYAGEILDQHRVLAVSDLIRRPLPRAEEPLYNTDDLGEETAEEYNYQSYNDQDSADLSNSGFYLFKHIKNGVFNRPKTVPDELMRHIRRVQRLKELFFFSSLFEKQSGDPSGGLFSQACIDYLNKHDPIIPRTGPDWVSWKVHVLDDTPCYINDKRLFLEKPTPCNVAVSMFGFNYRTTLKGTVCYAYTQYGEPLTVTATYCDQMQTNYLPKECFKKIQAAFYRNLETRNISLPLLKLSPNLTWKGHEISNFDVSYWHKQLGHLSLRCLKKYVERINGMPPLLWPRRIRCKACYDWDGPV
ncbi:hypothetical protein CJU90_4440 [Yarrowia sp. C11]|nr:hypothetical protein CKK34_6722 [Yarrowia sp. E02]KAG5365363.1 hypothetical protein CJU90_4440 [Yarrowia sp. C11]